MRMNHARTTRTRLALAALMVGATVVSGCVQYGSGRGRSVPVEDEDHGGEDGVMPAEGEGSSDGADPVESDTAENSSKTEGSTEG